MKISVIECLMKILEGSDIRKEVLGLSEIDPLWSYTGTSLVDADFGMGLKIHRGKDIEVGLVKNGDTLDMYVRPADIEGSKWKLWLSKVPRDKIGREMDKLVSNTRETVGA